MNEGWEVRISWPSMRIAEFLKRATANALGYGTAYIREPAGSVGLTPLACCMRVGPGDHLHGLHCVYPRFGKSAAASSGAGFVKMPPALTRLEPSSSDGGPVL